MFLFLVADAAPAIYAILARQNVRSDCITGACESVQECNCASTNEWMLHFICNISKECNMEIFNRNCVEKLWSSRNACIGESLFVLVWWHIEDEDCSNCHWQMNNATLWPSFYYVRDDSSMEVVEELNALLRLLTDISWTAYFPVPRNLPTIQYEIVECSVEWTDVRRKILISWYTRFDLICRLE